MKTVACTEGCVLEWVKLICSGVFAVLIAISDAREYKIKNVLVLPFLLFGLTFNALFGGLSSFQNALVGMVLPLCLLPLFGLKMLGAGDIKAFCTLGSILGWRWSIDVVLYSFVAAGILAIGFLLLRKNAAARFGNLLRYMKLCLYNRRLLPYSDFVDTHGRFRFAFGILGGYIIVALTSIYR